MQAGKTLPGLKVERQEEPGGSHWNVLPTATAARSRGSTSEISYRSDGEIHGVLGSGLLPELLMASLPRHS